MSRSSMLHGSLESCSLDHTDRLDQMVMVRNRDEWIVSQAGMDLSFFVPLQPQSADESK